MKKFIALCLGLTIFAFMLTGVGCESKPGLKKPTGTNGAKLLLANENLDETIFLEGLDVWTMGEGTASEPISQGVITAPSITVGAPLSGANIMPMGVTEQGEYTYWSDFEDYSDTMRTFNSIIEGVEKDSAEVAEEIGWIKKNVGVTDRWIDGKHLLQVKEGEEILYTKHDYESWNGYQVARRHTRSDAKNVYEIYLKILQSSGTIEQRTMFIPGEYYEWTDKQMEEYFNSFVVENSDGIWKMTRVFYDLRNGEGNEYFSFDNYVLKDGFGLGFNYIFRKEDGVIQKEGVNKYNFFDIANKRQMFDIGYLDSQNAYFFSTYLCNVESGVSSLRALTDNLTETGGINSDGQLILSGGEVYGNGYGRVEKVFDDGSDEGRNILYGWMNHRLSGNSLVDALLGLQTELQTKGITLKSDVNTIINDATYVELLADEFKDTFEWNGFYMAKDIEACLEGKAWLDSFFAGQEAMYGEVKDNPSQRATRMSYSGAGFAEVSVTGGDGEYADGKITVTELGITISDTTLLEAGQEYVIKLGLSLENEGRIEGVHTVALSAESEQMVEFSGEGDLAIVQSGEYALPHNVSQGEYVVVAYVATADEGIRVSEMQPLGFVNSADGEIQSAAMDICVTKTQENTLIVKYTIKNTLRVELEAGRQYGREEIERLLLNAVLNNGYPLFDEVVEQTDNGYRLKCLLPIDGELTEAYVYCEVASLSD